MKGYFFAENLQPLVIFLKDLEEIARSSACPWPAVHKFLTSEKVKEFCTEIQIHKSVILQIALQFCEDIVNEPGQASSNTVGCERVTEDQTEVLEYIGGAILCKLRKRYERHGRMAAVDVVNSLINPNNDTKPSLIKTKSRGGLITPVQELTCLVSIAYKKFKAGLKSSDQLVEDVLLDVPENSTMADFDPAVLKDIIKLFHLIMSHHQCYLFLEQLKIKNKCTGKGKALRVKLADKYTL